MNDIVYRQKVRDLNARAKQQGSKGRLNENDLLAVLEYYGAHCLVPDCTNTDVQFDHVIPLEKQGPNARLNLQLLCESHNKAKSEIDYRNGNICPDSFKPKKQVEKRENGNNGNHGKKGRSGRKPSEYLVLKRRIQSEKVNDAERAFDLYVQIMENPDEETGVRLAAADRVLDRVVGKPAIVQPNAGEELYRLYTERLKAFVFDGKPTAALDSPEGLQLAGGGLLALAAASPDSFVA